ncbi:MAG: hypothetical protein ACC618_02250 [Patescibacteria group bacterium]
MFPTETSLIPVTVALARFIESNGIASMLGEYPYWYLGVPYQYLTGPIVPLLQVFLHRVLPGLSLFEITYILLFLSFLASVFGWFWLVVKIQKVRFKLFSFSTGHLAFIIFLILPWRYLSTLALSEASVVISKNLLPFALLAFWSFYKKKDRKNAFIAVFALSVLLLINTTILTIFAVGVTALILAASFKKGKIRGLTQKIKPSLFLILYSLILVTLWYTPGYWWTVVTNPSIGGASGIKVFLRVFDLAKASIPLILAVTTVYFSGKIKSRLSLFSLTWLFTFLFLTVFRFIGDPDFWQDWTSWLSELEIGVALLISISIINNQSKIFSISHLLQRSKLRLALVIFLLVLPFFLTNYVYGLLNRPPLISKQIPQGVRSLEKLSELAAGGSTELTTLRVFLSGSTVFWANALYDLNQVRGGVDKGATHPYWDHAAFQLREGSDSELAQGWLESLGVSYVLVHGPNSSEVYRDFRNIDKWNKVGEIVWEDQGDMIIKVSQSSLSWVADLAGFENVEPPQGGDDSKALSNYLAEKLRPLEVKWLGSNIVQIDIGELSEGEGVVLARSYRTSINTTDLIKIKRDALGNTFLVPTSYNNLDSIITLSY